MLKEKYESVKKVVKEHKTEIITGTICVAATVTTGIFMGKAIKNRKSIETMSKEFKCKDDMIKTLKSRINWISGEAIEAHCRLDTACDIAYNSLKREQARIQFTIEELENYIANLDHTKTINVFHRIPEKEKMINDLKTQLKDIDFDISRIEDQIGFLLEDETNIK